MQTPRRITETRKVELVETHNLTLSLVRLQEGYDMFRWRRSFYHAAAMAQVGSGLLEKLRIALELP